MARALIPRASSRISRPKRHGQQHSPWRSALRLRHALPGHAAAAFRRLTRICGLKAAAKTSMDGMVTWFSCYLLLTHMHSIHK